MDLDSDMNATPLSKLQPMVQTRADGPRVDPPNYTDLLNTMDVQPAAAAAAPVQYYQDEPPTQYSQQQPDMYHQYAQQQPQIVYVPEPAQRAPPPATDGGGALTRALRQHKDILVVAALAFAAMHFGAPRLRGGSALVNSTGGLNVLGLGLLALAIGFGTRASTMI
jgi:hypothetical protein